MNKNNKKSSSVQFSLVVINTSGVIARVTILLRKFQFIPISQKVSETTDPAKSTLDLVANGSGDLEDLSTQLLNLRGVISILSIKDSAENNIEIATEQIKEKKSAHIINDYNESKKQQNEEILKNFFGEAS